EGQQFLGHLGAVEAVAFSSDSKTLASAGIDKTVRLWNVEKGAEVATLAGHANTVLAVAFKPSDDRAPEFLASGGGDGFFRVWGLSDELNPRTLRGHTLGVSCVAFGGGRLASCCIDEHAVRLWEPLTGKEIARIPCNAYAAAFSPDGRLLVTVGGDAFQS